MGVADRAPKPVQDDTGALAVSGTAWIEGWSSSVAWNPRGRVLNVVRVKAGNRHPGDHSWGWVYSKEVGDPWLWGSANWIIIWTQGSSPTCPER